MKSVSARGGLVPLLEPEPTLPQGGSNALFRLGFRPFYLLAALWAALAVPAWIAQYAGLLPPPRAYPAMLWHAHEMTFGFALVIIFLVLAAQFESFVSAVIIMVTVPLGLACAVFAMIVTGTTLNIYSQIGLVLLVGIMAKNGILIVEFANQLRDRGQDIRSAIENASNIRLRPVLMTMIATVVGALPLVLASGAGAEARIALGWVLVGGLGLATVVTLYLTPVAYLVIARFASPHADEEKRLAAELQHAETLARRADDEALPQAAE